MAVAWHFLHQRHSVALSGAFTDICMKFIVHHLHILNVDTIERQLKLPSTLPVFVEGRATFG